MTGLPNTVRWQLWIVVYVLTMAVIIALPALLFARVPKDSSKNVAIARRKRSPE